MLRILKRLKPLPFCASFSLIRKDADGNNLQNNLHKEKDLAGWDKVKSIFYIDEFDNISHEMNYVFQSTSLAIFTGIIYGGITNSRAAYIKFMENNHATAFENTFEAKKILQDKITIALGKGAWKWGWRLAIFTFCFTSITTLISTYRGDASILDYTVAGFLTGSLYKLNGGLHATIVGGVLGTVLATIAGSISVGLLQISGTSMDDIKYWQYKFRESRKRHYEKIVDKTSEEKNTPIEKLHDSLIKKENPIDPLKDLD